MIGDPVAELIVGIGRDPVIGLYLLVGSGGVLAELVGDSRILMLPATREEIGAAIGALKAGRLLDGFRGGPRGDLSAAVDAAMIVQSFALEKADRLLELDINPLLVLAEGDGVVAADVLIRFTGEDDCG
jgi:acetate---CoA ligase (ADP-forming)